MTAEQLAAASQPPAPEVQRAKVLPHLGLSRFEAEESARQRITRYLVFGYLGVLLLSLAPTVVYLAANQDSLATEDVTSLTAATAGAVASLTGLLGFVLGYYFKSSEDEA